MVRRQAWPRSASRRGPDSGDDGAMPAAERYARLEAWGSIATAIFTGLGLVVAIVASVVAYITYKSAERESELKTTADALSEWSKASPPNATQCFAFLKPLSPKELAVIVARQEFHYQDDAAQSLIACLSDQTEDEINKALINKDKHILLPRGTSFVAERVNASLDADSVVAAFILKGIGNTDILYDEIGHIICRDDLKLVQTLRLVPERTHSYPSIFKFGSLPQPLGCHQSDEDPGRTTLIE